VVAAAGAVGFTVRDGHYLSARWPGDAHRFASEFAAMIAEFVVPGLES
jgi:hypothetical protein